MAKATSAAKTATPKGMKKNKKLTLMIIPFVILDWMPRGDVVRGVITCFVG